MVAMLQLDNQSSGEGFSEHTFVLFFQQIMSHFVPFTEDGIYTSVPLKDTGLHVFVSDVLLW